MSGRPLSVSEFARQQLPRWVRGRVGLVVAELSDGGVRWRELVRWGRCPGPGTPVRVEHAGDGRLILEGRAGGRGASSPVVPGEAVCMGGTWVAVWPSVWREGAGEVAHCVDGTWAASNAMRRALLQTARVAKTSAPVLIHGESGTGKERIARLVHRLGPRRGRPFVAVNCGAVPESLAPAEFFGSASGAFTGARTREGYFGAADGGTLFLDEVGELAANVQAALLRVLENGEVQPVGGRPRSVDVRVIAATHRDLETRASEGLFREDLVWRLDVLRIDVPPLRHRREDVPFLARALLAREGLRVEIEPQAFDLLWESSLPGNVRQLRNALVRAAAWAGTDRVDAAHLRRALGRGRCDERTETASREAPSARRTVRSMPSDEVIVAELIRQGGHRRRTWEALGIPRSTFYRWLARNRPRVEQALAEAQEAAAVAEQTAS